MLFWSHEAFVSALALSLMHSLWQGALVGLLGFALNQRLKSATPDVRCGAFSLLLITFFLVWLGTFGCLYHEKCQTEVFLSGTTIVFANQTLSAAPLAQTGESTLVTLLQSVSPLLVAFWTLGVCALSLKHIGGLLLLHQLSRAETTACPPAWEACATRLKRQMGIRRSIQLRCSTRIDVPFAFGLLKSSILLPLNAMTGLAPEQVEALIAHELAHFARHDVLLNFFQVCIETILFYHPVVRWLSLQIRAAREQACDDLAIQIIGDRALYARALFSLEEARASIPQLALGAKGDTSKMTNTHLIRRIQRVLGTAGPEKRDPWAKGALALGATALGIAALLPVYAQSPKPGSPTIATPTAPHLTPTTHVLLNIDGRQYQLDLVTGALTPETKVKVNGKTGRFEDLTSQEQKALRDMIHLIPALPTKGLPATITLTQDRSAQAANVTGSGPTKFYVTAPIGKDSGPSTAYVTATDDKPGIITVTTDGSFAGPTSYSTTETGPEMITITTDGDGPSAEAFITKGDGSLAQIVKDTDIQLNINGDKIELNTTNLTPDTQVIVNGVTGRFGDLTLKQQKQINEHLQSIVISAPVTIVQGKPLTLDNSVTSKDTFNGKTTPIVFNVQRAVDTKPVTTVNLPLTLTNPAATISVPVTVTNTPKK